MKQTTIVSIDVDVTNPVDAASRALELNKNALKSYICVANVHMTIECLDDSSFADIVNGAALVVPDGRPLFWVQRLLGESSAAQVRGYDLMQEICRLAALEGAGVGFYGNSPEVLDKTVENLKKALPDLKIDYAFSPPFRPLTEAETQSVTNNINDSGVQILFVSLGCPKQEQWMSANHKNVNCVMVGVGAAFDFVAGSTPQAPLVMQKLGLEWVYRLLMEPRRLFKRYATTNPKFVWHAGKQVLSHKLRMTPKR